MGGYVDARSNRPRLMIHGRSRLRVEVDAGVTPWTGHDPDLPALVSPQSPTSGLALRDVTAQRAWRGLPARTELLASCGRVQVRDQLLGAAEPVGRARNRAWRWPAWSGAVDGPLDLTHDLRLARTQGCGGVTWRSLNRFVFGYFAGRKVTVQVGKVSVRDERVSSRLRADPGARCVVTVAFDGHLPADAALVTALLR
jgi:hypothetical protein